MKLDEQIAKIAALIGDKTRAAILLALMDGKAMTAGELALRANVSAQTASNHLKKLLNANLIELVTSRTRYHYYKISSHHVGNLVEAIAILLPNKHAPIIEKKVDIEMAFARTCYDHLAGKLGVEITNILQQKNIIHLDNNIFVVSKMGKDFFSKLLIDTSLLKTYKRQFAKPCLDWTEREYHLAGSLGKAILDYMIENKLILHSKSKHRVLYITEKGKRWLGALSKL